MNQTKPRIAFIGVGTMGGPMAIRVAEGGWDVVVYDVSQAAMNRAVKAGAREAKSPAAAAAGAEVVVTMLPDSSHVRAAVLGEQGVIDALKPGTLFIEMSTIAVSASAAIAQEIKARGARFVDAPVGRSPEDARKGTLLVMAGGAADDIARAMPIFRCFADTIVHVGPEGHGIRLKLVNNYMSMINVAVAAETLTLAAKAGLDRSTVVKVLSGTAAGRGQLVVNYPKKVLAGDITPDFPLRMAHKDLGLALQLGDEVKSPLMIGALARELFGLATPMGRAEQDCTAMLLMLEDLAGVSRAKGQSGG